MPRSHVLALVPVLALLAACDPAPEDDGRDAPGEVLDGTISDAMLPVDSVRSQAPLMPQTRSSGAADAGESAEDAAGDDTDTAADGAEAPAAEAAGEDEAD